MRREERGHHEERKRSVKLKTLKSKVHPARTGRGAKGREGGRHANKMFKNIIPLLSTKPNTTNSSKQNRLFLRGAYALLQLIAVHCVDAGPRRSRAFLPPAVKWQTGYEKQFTAWLCGGAYVHKLPTEKVRKTPPVVIANATAIHTGVQVHLSLRRATVARERVQERAQEE